MTETVTLTIDQLNQLIDQRIGARPGGGGPGVLPDPEMEGLLGVPPRSVPAHGAKAMEEQAKIHGGLWSADNPDWRKYGGVIITRGGVRKTVEACPHADPPHCDKCWTPQNEARWAYAYGLSEEPGPPLDKAEVPGSQTPSDPVRRTTRGPDGRSRAVPDSREPAHPHSAV